MIRGCKVLAGLILIAMPAISAAETITLKSGQVINGRIISQSKDAVKIDEGLGIPLTYFREKIARISSDSDFGIVSSLDKKEREDQADALQDKSVEAMDEARTDLALQLMKKAVLLDPVPLRRMNYGSMLFGRGVSIFKDGDKTQAKAILRLAQIELKKAIEGFVPSKDQVYLGQCYFLLGEIAQNAFANKNEAKIYYQKSADINDYPGAKDALTKL